MANEKDLIDFALVRRSVSMELLIVHFGIFALSKKGDEVRLKCPFHNGKSDNSMLIDLKQNSFYCFGCKARGDVLDFVAKYENCSLNEAALLMTKWFFGKAQSPESREATASKPADSAAIPITLQHLIASIEYQLARLKQMISR